MSVALVTYAIAGMLMLAGCASKSTVRYELFVFPTVGATATKSVGEAILEQGYSHWAPDIEILSEAKIGKLLLPKGTYPYYTENRTGIWFYRYDYYFYLNKADNLLCVDGKDCVKVDHVIRKRLIRGALRADSFQQTLLYNGKIGNKITLAYREFSNNLARPAFSNSAEYDLSESRVVGYKGARLEIINATNIELTYRVLSGFFE